MQVIQVFHERQNKINSIWSPHSYISSSKTFPLSSPVQVKHQDVDWTQSTTREVEEVTVLHTPAGFSSLLLSVCKELTTTCRLAESSIKQSIKFRGSRWRKHTSNRTSLCLIFIAGSLNWIYLCGRQTLRHGYYIKVYQPIYFSTAIPRQSHSGDFQTFLLVSLMK